MLQHADLTVQLKTETEARIHTVSESGNISMSAVPAEFQEHTKAALGALYSDSRISISKEEYVAQRLAQCVWVKYEVAPNEQNKTLQVTWSGTVSEAPTEKIDCFYAYSAATTFDGPIGEYRQHQNLHFGKGLIPEKFSDYLQKLPTFWKVSL